MPYPCGSVLSPFPKLETCGVLMVGNGLTDDEFEILDTQTLPGLLDKILGHTVSGFLQSYDLLQLSNRVTFYADVILNDPSDFDYIKVSYN